MTNPAESAPSPAGGSARRWAVDALIALAVTAAQIGATYMSSSWHQQHGQHGAVAAHGSVGALGYALAAVGGATLIGRRRYPAGVLAVTLAAALAAQATGNAGLVWLAVIVALFNAALARRRAAVIGSLVVGYVASVWPPWQIGQSGHPSVWYALWLLAFLLFLLSAAELWRLRSQRALAVERGREEQRRRRASEERMRMARDLHDVVAHNISVINVQANTALHLMDRQPERARAALSAINDVSKEALVELRSVLGVLRGTDENAPRTPSPGLGRLAELVDRAEAAGLAVRLEEDGRRVPLPANADLATYRIIQEALTNTARHAPGAAATVRVRYREQDVVIEVDDDGGGLRGVVPPGQHGGGLRGVAPPGQHGTARPGARPPGEVNGSGNGIAGMTERAHALGGTLHAGPRPGGGFLVRAQLPLPKEPR